MTAQQREQQQTEEEREEQRQHDVRLLVMNAISAYWNRSGGVYVFPPAPHRTWGDYFVARVEGAAEPLITEEVQHGPTR